MVELHGGTTAEAGEGWFTSAGKVKSGTVIMKALGKLDKDGKVSALATELGSIFYLFLHCALKSKNEACVEGYGSIIERHASKLRGNQEQANYANEGFVHTNGPLLHEADDLVKRALDLFFGKDNNGKQKPWHFNNTEASLAKNAGVLKNTDQSQVLKRLLGTESKVSFTAVKKPRRVETDS